MGQAGAPVEDPCEQPEDGFDGRAEAEAWVGEMWHDLVDEGVDQVWLLCDGEDVYGPMSLHPEK
ncbi:MAG: hypothetical protein QG608_606 [Actinomycetota bacterium]|nr:hypothetical protein [Actinomycetota bacterium]